MAEAEATITVKIEGQEILDAMKKVLKEMKQERKRIAKIVKEAS